MGMGGFEPPHTEYISVLVPYQTHPCAGGSLEVRQHFAVSACPAVTLYGLTPAI